MDATTEEPGRRRFLAGIIASIQSAIGASLAFVLGGAVLAPSFARKRENWLEAGSLGDLAESEPRAVTVRVARQDGYTQVVERQLLFLVKTGSSVTALSSTCTHLGCRVSWDAEAKQLKCPCHGGAYDATGAVVGGPPPSPLATIATRIEDERVLVQI